MDIETLKDVRVESNDTRNRICDLQNIILGRVSSANNAVQSKILTPDEYDQRLAYLHRMETALQAVAKMTLTGGSL